MEPERVVMARKVPLKEADRSFGLAFWQAQGSARFRAAWELVEHYHRRKGGNSDELRLQRTVRTLERRYEG